MNVRRWMKRDKGDDPATGSPVRGYQGVGEGVVAVSRCVQVRPGAPFRSKAAKVDETGACRRRR